MSFNKSHSMKTKFLLIGLLFAPYLFAQTPATKINFNKFYSYALQGNVKLIMTELNSTPDSLFNEDQLKIKQQYQNRFGHSNESFDYRTTDKEIIELTDIYHRYWKNVLLKQLSNDKADSLFKSDVETYLTKYDQKKSRKDFTERLTIFLKSKGYYATLGKTASVYDFLVWKKESKVIYTVTLPHKTQKAKVIFMEEPLSWGWEEYATFGKYYPGGWATKKDLHCVKQAYDLSSETFQVSYLKHEAMHFSDYKEFPDLNGADLEYRAKLIEMSYATTTLHPTIRFFILNSSNDQQNPHSYANFCVVQNLTEKIFNTKEPQTDYTKWNDIPAEQIHAAALQLLSEKNTELEERRMRKEE
jgi:hypothetical protein